MFNALTGLGWGVVTFAITIGIGVIVLSKFGTAVSACADHATLSPGAYYNESTGVCSNATVSNVGGAGTGSANVFYLGGQLGTSGLAGWAPAIIAFAVGMMFLGGFLINRGKNRSY